MQPAIQKLYWGAGDLWVEADKNRRACYIVLLRMSIMPAEGSLIALPDIASSQRNSTAHNAGAYAKKNIDSKVTKSFNTWKSREMSNDNRDDDGWA
jgi:hypothetical protein